MDLNRVDYLLMLCDSPGGGCCDFCHASMFGNGCLFSNSEVEGNFLLSSKMYKPVSPRCLSSVKFSGAAGVFP